MQVISPLITLLFVFCAFSSFLIYQVEKLHYRDVLGLAEVHVQNGANDAQPLFSSQYPKGKSIGMLDSGDSFPFLYPGQSGIWLHGTWKGQQVFMKSSSQHKAVKFNNFVIPIAQLISGLIYASGALLLLMLICRLRCRERFSLEGNEHQLRQQARLIIEKDDAIKSLACEIEHYRGVIKTLDQEKALLLEKVTTWKRQYDQKMVDEFRERERGLQQQFIEEAQLRTHVQIPEMQASLERVTAAYQALKVRHQQILDEAIHFDLKFDGERYENLLKGRKFEIFFAKQLLQDPDIGIIEWTSDKGFESNIYVKSNGNPDFLICYRKSFYFAVECKYRGGFFFKDKAESRISWSSAWQTNRYARFSEERKVPVYIALGFKGEPDQPEKNFFCSLSTLIHRSSSEKVFFKGKTDYQQVVDLSELSDCILASGQFSSEIIKSIQ